MPGMFSRRRTPSLPPPNKAPSSSAAIAASSAFLKSSPSSASLSSAAAAAALRSQTVSPELVGNIQTKRMVRRGSQSSIGSGSIMGGGRGGMGRGLVRQDSSGSMTERTFRSPSPARASTNGAVPAAHDAPPVPSMPSSKLRQSRSSSVEPPMRISSPPPRGGRNASVDRTSFVGNGRGKRLSSLPKLPELERGDSNRSVNFSRPMSPGPTTPPIRPQSSAGWFASPKTNNITPRSAPHARPASSLGLTSSQVSGIQQKVQSAATAPVSKKKKKVVDGDQGTHLAAGSMVGGPTGTSVNGTSTRESQPQQPANALPAQSTGPKKKKTAPPAIDTDVEPPPRNPARPTPSSPRAAGLLHKQPSIVREDPEGEEAAVRSLNTRPQKSANGAVQRSASITTSAGPAVAYIAPSASHNRSVSLDVPRPMENGQAQSLRPAHAHFSSLSVIDSPSGFKHNPLPRSISPAKSALKASPASSVRGSSPATSVGLAKPLPPPSDTSDTTSMASQDGIKPAKKRVARVSFDDAATKPVVQSTSPLLVNNDEEDESMKPRPALPSFGSVRKQNARPRSEVSEKATETLQSSVSKDQSTLEGNGEASSDFALGGILANHYASKSVSTEREAEPTSQGSEPLPPQVTSVEGSGYQSDSDNEVQHEAAAPNVNVPASRDAATSSSEVDSITEDTGIEVPNIQVLPATPGPEDVQNPITEKSTAARRFSMPGSWDEEEEHSASMIGNSSSDGSQSVSQPLTSSRLQQLDAIYETDSDDSGAFSDAAEDFSENEGGFASLDAMVESPMVKSPSQSTLPAQPDTPTKVTNITRSDGADFMGPGGDWSQATAYWSSLSKKHKEQLENQTMAPDAATQTAAAEPRPKKVKAKAVMTNQTPVSALKSTSKPRQRAPPQDDSQTLGEARPPTMKKSMRGPSPSSTEEPHMRSTMRSGGAMRGSMRDGPVPAQPQGAAQPRDALQKKNIRPASSSGLPASSVPAPSLRAQANRNSAGPMAQPLARTTTNDSDSDSSFRKKRRPSTSTMDSAGKYTMKRSMRASSVDVTSNRRPASSSGAPNSSRWSVRSASPPASSVARNRENLRTSLRGGVADDTPTMRGKNSKARESKSPSRFSVSSFSRPAKPAQAPAPSIASAKPKSAFRSRFGDSDSDDEAPRGPYRSRFVDSDEEDSPVGPPRQIPANLTPVRGIPRRGQDEGDSTDLDDSEDDGIMSTRAGNRDASRVKGKPIVPSQADVDKAMAAARRNVAAMTGNTQLAEPTTPQKNQDDRTKHVQLQTQADTNGATTNGVVEPASPLNRQRRGLMGSIFGRRRTSSVNTLPTLASQGMDKPSIPNSPRSEAIASPQTSQAIRPGKLQRRNTSNLSRSGSEMLAGTGETAAPMLNMPPDWPLPPPIPESTTDGNYRPNTSDGVGETDKVKLASTMRPQMGLRSQTGVSVARSTAPEPVYSEKTGRKKKFSRLRKAFGLND